MEASRLREYWDKNADAWTDLSRQGYDIHRDLIISPAFMRILPKLNGKSGLDIGCGEGYNTQKIADQGANVTGIDISDQFILHAKEREKENPNLKFIVGDATELPFKDQEFDFCVSFNALMTTPNQEKILREIHRVLKSGCLFQFSITHPIFTTKRWDWVYEADRKIGIIVGDYFEPLNGAIDEWIFGSAPDDLKVKYPKFKIPRFTKTISEWINLLITTGFKITRVEEPTPSDEVIQKYPDLADAKIVPYFLILQCEKESRSPDQEKLIEMPNIGSAWPKGEMDFSYGSIN